MAKPLDEGTDAGKVAEMFDAEEVELLGMIGQGLSRPNTPFEDEVERELERLEQEDRAKIRSLGSRTRTP